MGRAAYGLIALCKHCLDLIGRAALSMGAVALLLVTLSASAAPSGVSSVTWTDHFNGVSLDSRWSWIREDARHWSLATRPGCMRIITQEASGTDTRTVENLLLQNAPAGDFEIRARLFFTPTQNVQGAGLLVYQDDSNALLLSHSFCNLPVLCAGDAIYFSYVMDGSLSGANLAVAVTGQTETTLRLIRHGSVYTGYVSLNGTDWTRVGTYTTSAFVPAKIGLSASHAAGWGAAEIPADFDYFQVDDNSYRVFLPVIIR